MNNQSRHQREAASFDKLLVSFAPLNSFIISEGRLANQPKHAESVTSQESKSDAQSSICDSSILVGTSTIPARWRTSEIPDSQTLKRQRMIFPDLASDTPKDGSLDSI